LSKLDLSLVGEKALVGAALSKMKLYTTNLTVPFFEGLLSVKSLLRAACLQFKRVEDRFKQVEANLLYLSENKLQESKDKFEVDILELNKMLSILVSLEDQLF
jgi:hypothetical protein